MLAKKFSAQDSELPTRPFNARPTARVEGAQTHLMLVREPSPTPRGLAWARRGASQAFDATRLVVMLRHERLNQG
jgi:hypothetical protein